MKRGGPLERRTPMPRGTAGLQRTAMRPRSMRVKARPRDFTREAAWSALRALLHARAGGRCERCGADLDRTGLDAHHRRLRSQGGQDDAATCVALCPGCHRHVHAQVAEAIAANWIVPSWGGDPALAPVVLHTGRLVWLTRDGGYADRAPAVAA